MSAFDTVFDVSILFTSFLVVLVTFLLWTGTSRRPRRLPLGPPVRVPILGNLIDLSPTQILETLKGYRSTYGDVFSLKFGSRWIVVLNGSDTIKEFLVKNADVFSNRPDIFFVTKVCQKMGIVGSSGALWKEHRTFSLAALRQFGFGKRSLESDINAEVQVCLQTLEETRGKPCDITNIISTSISNVTCALLFGKRFEYTNPRCLSLLKCFDENLKYNGSASLSNWIPWLLYIPGDLFKAKKTLKNVCTMDRFIHDIIEEHQETYDENNIRDYIDAFINEMKKHGGEKGHTFTEKQLPKSVLDIFGDGTETTTTTIRWAILYSMHYPEVQEKMAREMQGVVGDSRFPSMTDRSHLPYCEAVITEVLRCGDIAPLSLPHAVDRDFEYKGYIIPKEAIVLPNLDSIMTDPKVFPDPDIFNPSRFLDKDKTLVGQEKVLVFSTAMFFAYPFSSCLYVAPRHMFIYGTTIPCRRVCLGEALARMELFLFLTSMVQRFKFIPEEGKPAPPLDCVVGITRSPNSYTVRAILRT